jgi:Leucine-rich repeat (LRR) protein
MLSLTYCGIDSTAAQALFEILIYTRSALEEINLSGNLLRNDGTEKVLQGTSIAKSLKKISLADNQFNDDERMLKAIEFCMVKNKKLTKYDFKYNNITDLGTFSLKSVTVV